MYRLYRRDLASSTGNKLMEDMATSYTQRIVLYALDTTLFTIPYIQLGSTGGGRMETGPIIVTRLIRPSVWFI